MNRLTEEDKDLIAEALAGLRDATTKTENLMILGDVEDIPVNVLVWNALTHIANLSSTAANMVAQRTMEA